MKSMERCRACRSDRMFSFLPLGMHPPANKFLTFEELSRPEAKFPLNVHVCLECALIQVANHIPANFFRHYIYMPSASATMLRHFADLAQTLRERFIDSDDDLMVDIGCNDGLFLKSCNDLGCKTLGIEPAANIAEIARDKGVNVVNEYFSPELAESCRNQTGQAKIIVTTNTFNHIDDLHDFMDGIIKLLTEDGVFVIEVPTALDLIEKNEFDTVYHEHVSEFSLKSLVDLFSFFKMEIFDVEQLSIHGGSMRVYSQKIGANRENDLVVDDILKREHERDLFSESTYVEFASRVTAIKEELLSMLKTLKNEGKKVAGYGAPAKGNTLLNYYGIGPDHLEFLADRNALKQGMYSPGMHIPIVAPAVILEEQPDYLLILAWNFAEEIIEQQDEYRVRGGGFIVPIPEPKFVNELDKMSNRLSRE